MKLKNIMNNFNTINIKNVEFYFSYETLICIRRKKTVLIAKNEWSRTTGKHINYLKEAYSNMYLEVDYSEVEEFAKSLF